jgi:hypothetical protein
MLFCEWYVSNVMSCKIERIGNGRDFVVLRVSGRIDGENVETLREVIVQEKGGVAIDLTEVTLVDREAVRLFAVSEANGVQLRNCPPYIREWVAREKDRQISSPKEGATNDTEAF